MNMSCFVQVSNLEEDVSKAGDQVSGTCGIAPGHLSPDAGKANQHFGWAPISENHSRT